jgi:hypothetical protein
MSDSPGRRTTERRGGKQQKKRARKLEGACSWRKKQKAACDHLGEAETKLAARGSRAGPSLPFSGSERSRMRVIDVERRGGKRQEDLFKQQGVHRDNELLLCWSWLGTWVGWRSITLVGQEI